MKKIYFHIDDFGVFPSLDRYILSLIKNNKVNGVSIICNSKFSGQFIPNLKKLIKKKKLFISCHINLSDFNARKYKFNFFKLLYYSLFPNRRVSKIINKSVFSQINFFIRKIPINKKIIYIDGHRHIHILPVVQNEIIKVLKKKKLKFKFRNSNENFFLYLKLNFLNRLVINYFKLFIIKLIYMSTNHKKKFYNDNFIGVIGTGVQHKEILIKCLRNLKFKNKKKIQILFHPLNVSFSEIKKKKLNISDYKYYLSKDRKHEINFFNSIISKNHFLKKEL